MIYLDNDNQFKKWHNVFNLYPSHVKYMLLTFLEISDLNI